MLQAVVVEDTVIDTLTGSTLTVYFLVFFGVPWNSAHDNIPTYELLEHWDINALIDINGRAKSGAVPGEGKVLRVNQPKADRRQYGKYGEDARQSIRRRFCAPLYFLSCFLIKPKPAQALLYGCRKSFPTPFPWPSWLCHDPGLNINVTSFVL